MHPETGLYSFLPGLRPLNLPLDAGTTRALEDPALDFSPSLASLHSFLQIGTWSAFSVRFEFVVKYGVSFDDNDGKSSKSAPALPRL